MISHNRAQQLISARMDAPLTSAEHRELHAHLTTCETCGVFVATADDLARGMHVLPRLAPSPAVSRAVMAAIETDTSGWSWLRQALQALSSPGMAVASGLALVVALAGAMFVALNAPGGDDGSGADPEGTIAALADVPLPTAIPTEIAEVEPTATNAPSRTIAAPPTRTPAKTPTPRPTATRVPAAIQSPVETPVNQGIEPVVVEQPPIEPVSEDPALALAPAEEIAPSAELAQTVEEPAAPADGAVASDVSAEAAPEGEAAPEAVAAEPAPEGDGGQNARRGDGGRKDNNGQAAPDEAPPAAEPVATEPLPVPDEAITALENAGASSGNVLLPPAPELPMPPSQAFLPITPTPVSDGTPTPEPPTQADAPQLAEEWSGDLPVTALAPEDPNVTVVESEEIVAGEKRDKSSKDGKSHANEQRAYEDFALGWSMESIDLLQDPDLQATDPAAATVTPADTAATTAPAADPAIMTTDPAIAAETTPQYDPVTGYEIDIATGLLVDPVTGYLLDLVSGHVYHRETGYQVHPYTGLLIDPVTGAQLDPVTLAIVIPADFGSETPAYDPGNPAMRGQIETNVDATYDDATYKVVPATDGPVQPIGEIIVPTESGDALEIVE